MSVPSFESRIDREGALRGVVRFVGGLDRHVIQARLFDLERYLRQLACVELPEILRPRPLKVYPEANTPPAPHGPCEAGVSGVGRRRIFDHIARVRQYLHSTPAVPLPPERLGQSPRCLVMLVFSGSTCCARLTPVFAQLPARTRAQLLIDWRDALVWQSSLLLKETLR